MSGERVAAFDGEWIAKFDYHPNRPDAIFIYKNDTITNVVNMETNDGEEWGRGINQNTQKEGIFPASVIRQKGTDDIGFGVDFTTIEPLIYELSIAISLDQIWVNNKRIVVEGGEVFAEKDEELISVGIDRATDGYYIVTNNRLKRAILSPSDIRRVVSGGLSRVHSPPVASPSPLVTELIMVTPPSAPMNPVKGTTIQVGCSKDSTTQLIPPAWVVFSTKVNEQGVVGHTGTNVNRVPVGTTALEGDNKILGVSIGGICDTAAAGKFPESAGRYAVAVEGKVVVTLKSDGDPLKAGDTVYIVSDETSRYYRPFFEQTPQLFLPKVSLDPTNNLRLGMITWVSPNHTRKPNPVAEVEVLLQIY